MDTLTASAPSRHQPEPPGIRPPAPADGRVDRRDLGGATPWLFYGGLVVAAVLVLLTAGGLDVAGNILGILGAGLLHGAVAALMVGLYLERVHADWTFLKGGQHALMILALLVVAPVTFLVDRFVLHLGLAIVPAVAYVVVAVASAVGAGVMAFLVVCPSHLGRRQRAVFLPFVGLFGMTAGVLAMALVVAGLAVWRMHRLPDVHLSVPTVSGIEGDYVALGDSYSAGEGLRPFSWYTGDADTSRGDGCHRSARAYSQLLVFAGGQTATRFAACSGAVTRDLEHGLTIHRDDGAAVRIPPQIDGKVHPSVGLVTLTIGGNDVVFSSVVRHCFFHQRCLAATFTPPTDARVALPPKAPLAAWATAAISLLRARVDVIYRDLRTGYPNARIVVIGYPYLFPSGRASRWPDDCYSLLRRCQRGRAGPAAGADGRPQRHAPPGRGDRRDRVRLAGGDLGRPRAVRLEGSVHQLLQGHLQLQEPGGRRVVPSQRTRPGGARPAGGLLPERLPTTAGRLVDGRVRHAGRGRARLDRAAAALPAGELSRRPERPLFSPRRRSGGGGGGARRRGRGSRV